MQEALAKAQKDLLDAMHAKDDENAKLRAAMQARIDEYKVALDELRMKMEKAIADKDKAMVEAAAAAAEALLLAEEKLKAEVKRFEIELAEKVAAHEAKILEITSAHEVKLKKQKGAAEQKIQHLMAELAMTKKEVDLQVKQVEAKTRELRDTVASLTHDFEIKEGKLTA